MSNETSAVKKSVRLSAETAQMCNILSPTGEVNWSGSLNALASEYRMLVELLQPEIDENLFLALCCAYNGRIPHPDMKWELDTMAWMVSEAYTHDSQAKELIDQVDGGLYKAKQHMESLTTGERLALYFRIREYWSSPTFG